ncbi:PadR family transcriptional regulator [Novosphingobium sp.]|uniref:PadR family transcriptional regulator n=1 Tax=Novosphingobium sp. TaxID=1874826 RepID=UPI003D0DAA64
MRFDKRSHGDRNKSAHWAHMMGHIGMAGMEFMRAGGRGGPFGRHGGDFGDEGRGPGHGRGGFGGGFGGDGFGRGRGRGARMFGQGELRLLLLSLLAGENRHGYDLIKAVEDLTGGAYAPSPGVVYPTLSLLVDEGLIAETPGEGARKAFAATDAGRAEAESRSEEIATIIERLKALADATSRESSPPVMRAMANLKLALRGRVYATGFDESVAHQIADVLDEAARKIERL